MELRLSCTNPLIIHSIISSCEVSKLGNCPEIWQCCQAVCQILERFERFNTQCHRGTTFLGLLIRSLMRYWNGSWFLPGVCPEKCTESCYALFCFGCIDGSAQNCSNSSALAMEILQSCAKPLILYFSLDLYESLTHILQGYFLWLSRCRWSNPEKYGSKSHKSPPRFDVRTTTK